MAMGPGGRERQVLGRTQNCAREPQGPGGGGGITRNTGFQAIWAPGAQRKVLCISPTKPYTAEVSQGGPEGLSSRLCSEVTPSL